MDTLFLREFTPADEAEIMALIAETKAQDIPGDKFEGIGSYGSIENYQTLLDKTEADKSPSPGRVPQSSYVLTDDTGHVYGIIRIRHALNDDLLQRGGNIGYFIRPKDRQKGYGTKMLALALPLAKDLNVNQGTPYEHKVLITCRKDNAASANVMLANGAQLDHEAWCEENQSIEQFYWIQL